MNERLLQFLAAENISQSQFADTIGVARASVSHIIAGRNKPGYDFICSIMKNYPSLNSDWLLLGKGKMYKGAAAEKVGDTIPTATAIHEPTTETQVEEEPDLFTQPQPSVDDGTAMSQSPVHETASAPALATTQASDNQRSITKIIVFYSDNTFQELKG